MGSERDGAHPVRAAVVDENELWALPHVAENRLETLEQRRQGTARAPLAGRRPRKRRAARPPPTDSQRRTAKAAQDERRPPRRRPDAGARRAAQASPARQPAQPAERLRFLRRRRPLHDRNVQKRGMDEAVDRAKFNGGQRAPTMHDLRHTFASLLIAEGLDVVFVTRQPGHANAATTLRVYASEFNRVRNADATRSAFSAGFGNLLETATRNQSQPASLETAMVTPIGGQTQPAATPAAYFTRGRSLVRNQPRPPPLRARRITQAPRFPLCASGALRRLRGLPHERLRVPSPLRERPRDGAHTAGCRRAR
jgi:Phage integrase family